MTKLDTLWLSGIVPDGNYSRSLYEWKRRILRLAVSIRSIAGRAMVTARRKAQEEAQEPALPILAESTDLKTEVEDEGEADAEELVAASVLSTVA